MTNQSFILQTLVHYNIISKMELYIVVHQVLRLEEHVIHEKYHSHLIKKL